jgi:hypothetical protein
MLEFSVCPMPVCSGDTRADFSKLSRALKAKGPPWWWAFLKHENLPIQQIGRSLKCLF